MTVADLTDDLAAILAEDVPFSVEVPPDEPAAPEPTVLRISPVGGGPAAEVRESEWLALVEAAGGVEGPDLSAADLGKLISRAKVTRPKLLPELLRVRSNCPLYRVRTSDGRSWRPTLTPTKVSA